MVFIALFYRKCRVFKFNIAVSDVPIKLFERSLELCVLEFGKYHIQTARCYQLYGQLYWNRYARLDPQRRDWLESSLPLYGQELEIQEELLGPIHPITVRARQDNIIVLTSLGRKGEAEKLTEKQPVNHEAL